MSDFEHVQDLLPEDGIPLAALRLVHYLSDSGKAKYSFLFEGEGSSTEIIGALEIIKSQLVSEAFNLGGLSD